MNLHNKQRKRELNNNPSFKFISHRQTEAREPIGFTNRLIRQRAARCLLRKKHAAHAPRQPIRSKENHLFKATEREITVRSYFKVFPGRGTVVLIQALYFKTYA